jgi:hypothetical protein
MHMFRVDTCLPQLWTQKPSEQHNPALTPNGARLLAKPLVSPAKGSRLLCPCPPTSPHTQQQATPAKTPSLPTQQWQ